MAQEQAIVAADSKNLACWAPGKRSDAVLQRRTLVEQSAQVIPNLSRKRLVKLSIE